MIVHEYYDDYKHIDTILSFIFSENVLKNEKFPNRSIRRIAKSFF